METKREKRSSACASIDLPAACVPLPVCVSVSAVCCLCDSFTVTVCKGFVCLMCDV
jgi:hypothetical protein